MAAIAQTDGKVVIVLSADEAAKFNAATGPVVEAVLAEAETNGLEAPAFTAVQSGQ